MQEKVEDSVAGQKSTCNAKGMNTIKKERRIETKQVSVDSGEEIEGPLPNLRLRLRAPEPELGVCQSVID